jgi:hypothetical protein
MTNTKLDALLRQAEQVEKLIKAELEKVSTFGEDKDYENGTVLCWVRNFASTGLSSYSWKKYTYVALKCSANRWYLTGMQSSYISFDSLVDGHLRLALEEGVDNIWMATKWEAIAEV